MFFTPPDAETLARMRERVHLVDAATVMDWQRTGSALIIDVREPHEFVRGHIPGALLRPLSAFDPAAISALQNGHRMVLHCAVGVRCGHAAMVLVRHGHPGPIHRIEGGISAWQALGGPLESGSWR